LIPSAAVSVSRRTAFGALLQLSSHKQFENYRLTIAVADFSREKAALLLQLVIYLRKRQQHSTALEMKAIRMK